MATRFPSFPITQGFLALTVALSLGVLLILDPGAARSQDAPQLTQEWEVTEGLERPESVAYDAEREVYYVSNLAGGASEKNGEGYLSRISVDGEVLEAEWAIGMNAPKGVAVHEGTVYTADIDALVAIDAETGEIQGRYPASGSEFLNDVTVDADGTVYVSDSGTNAVYRLSGGSLTRWLEGVKIKAPNGLFAEEAYLIVAATTFAHDSPGDVRHFQYVDYEDRSITIPQGDSPMGNIDGIKPDGSGGYFISEWGPGTVSHYHPDTGTHQLRELGQGAADLEYRIDAARLVVPVMQSHRLVGFSVAR